MYRQWVNLPPDQLYATIGVSRSSCMLDVEWPRPDRGDIDIKNVGLLRSTLQFSGPHSSLLFSCTCVPHFSFSVYCFFFSVYLCTTLFFSLPVYCFFSFRVLVYHTFLFTSGLLLFTFRVLVYHTFFSLPVYCFFFISVYLCTKLFFHFRFIAFFFPCTCVPHFFSTFGLLLFSFSVLVYHTFLFTSGLLLFSFRVLVYHSFLFTSGLLCLQCYGRESILVIYCMFEKHFLHLKFCLMCVCVCVAEREWGNCFHTRKKCSLPIQRWRQKQTDRETNTPAKTDTDGQTSRQTDIGRPVDPVSTSAICQDM